MAKKDLIGKIKEWNLTPDYMKKGVDPGGSLGIAMPFLNRKNIITSPNLLTIQFGYSEYIDSRFVLIYTETVKMY